MSNLVPVKTPTPPARQISASVRMVVPATIADACETASRRFLEFFAATIRNRNTRMGCVAKSRSGVVGVAGGTVDGGVVTTDQDGAFKGRHFTSEVILWALRWYLAFPISYRDLSAMLLDGTVQRLGG